MVTAAEEGDAVLAADLLSRGANVNAEHYNKTLFYASQVCQKGEEEADEGKEKEEEKEKKKKRRRKRRKRRRRRRRRMIL